MARSKITITSVDDNGSEITEHLTLSEQPVTSSAAIENIKFPIKITSDFVSNKGTITIPATKGDDDERIKI